MFENEAEYNYAMNAQAEFDAENYAFEEKRYNDYLESLIESKRYQLFGVEICLDFLTSAEFKESGLTEISFLVTKKNKLSNVNNEEEKKLSNDNF